MKIAVNEVLEGAPETGIFLIDTDRIRKTVQLEVGPNSYIPINLVPIADEIDRLTLADEWIDVHQIINKFISQIHQQHFDIVFDFLTDELESYLMANMPAKGCHIDALNTWYVS